MSRNKLSFLCAALITLCLPIFLQAQEPVPLPVRKVELYKNGMGFFEHLGTVKGPQSVEIVLPSSQLNDVLKSLTVLDLGGGKIAAVNYDSAASLDRRLSELPIDLTSASGLLNFLNQIRGAGIEVRTPAGLVAGKLMGAELKTKSPAPGVTVQEIVLNIFSSDGQIRLIELESAGALKLTDQALANDLGRYLGILDTTHQRDVRKLRIQTLGTGERQLYIGYTSETPIWKTSYRIVLDPKQKPLLQGWAIVDNTTPMDWLDVSLSLVAGAPISFIQDLAQPLYAQRPVVPVAQGIQAKPQFYEAAVEEDESDMRTNALDLLEDKGRASGGMPARSKALRMESFASAPPPPPPPSMPAELSDAIRRQVTSAAQAQAVGEQFEYKLRQPVTIRRNESALLPILQSDVEGEKVSIFRAADNELHPRLAFWLKNSSGLTLDAGPVTVIDSNAFAGEGLIETIQPGENRLLSYAIDLGTTMSTNSDSERKRVERVVIQQGMMRMLSKMVEKKTYKIRNNNETARSMVLEHPVRAGWKLIGNAPAETSANYYRFKVEAKPKSTTEFVIQEESPLETTFALSSITPEQIAIWIRDRSIDPEIEKLLQAIAQKQIEINDLARKIAATDKEQNDIFKDQERVRGNLQRLSQTPDEAALRLRYIKQLDGQENRLAVIKTEREKLEASRSAAEKQLEALVEKLSVDKAL
jgi:hypothetical protein